jgi:hypothetical protein
MISGSLNKSRKRFQIFWSQRKMETQHTRICGTQQISPKSKGYMYDCLLLKTKNRASMVVHDCNPRTSEDKKGGSQIERQPEIHRYIVSSRPSWTIQQDPILKTKQNKTNTQKRSKIINLLMHLKDLEKQIKRQKGKQYKEEIINIRLILMKYSLKE